MSQQRAIRKSHAVDIEELVRQLTFKHCVPLMLHFYGNLSYEEIASTLGWGRWKVKKRIYEALCIIRDSLGVVPVPLITVTVPSDIWRQVRGASDAETPENQLTLSDFGERVLMQANGGSSGCTKADAAAEAMENWPGMFFGESLRKIKPSWYLHAAVVGQQILLRAGFWDLTKEGYAPIKVEFWDEALWVFEDNPNEVWVHIFRDDLQKETLVSHLGKDLCRIKFKKAKDSFY